MSLCALVLSIVNNAVDQAVTGGSLRQKPHLFRPCIIELSEVIRVSPLDYLDTFDRNIKNEIDEIVIIFISDLKDMTVSHYMAQPKSMLGQSKFPLFTSGIARDRFRFERTLVFSLRISGFEMGEYAGDLPRKFICFHCLENESNVPKDHNTQETEIYLGLP